MANRNILLIRHGEAAASWDKENDPGLSNNGRKQAELLVDEPLLQNLENYDFISSPKKRAMETSIPLKEKFNKEITVNNIFSEIPAKNIPNEQKFNWLKKTVTANIDSLPKDIHVWRNNIIKNIFDELEGDTVIFTHFMVINTVIGFVNKSNKIFNTQPSYTSITSINFNTDGISIDINKIEKTHINI